MPCPILQILTLMTKKLATNLDISLTIEKHFIKFVPKPGNESRAGKLVENFFFQKHTYALDVGGLHFVVTAKSWRNLISHYFAWLYKRAAYRRDVANLVQEKVNVGGTQQAQFQIHFPAVVVLVLVVAVVKFDKTILGIYAQPESTLHSFTLHRYRSSIANYRSAKNAIPKL